MAKYAERIKARQMRKEGGSVRTIAGKLGVSKGSVSLWCSDIVLDESQVNKLKLNAVAKGYKGRRIGVEANRMKKVLNIQNFQKLGLKEIEKINKRDLLLLGTALYWAEGSKKKGAFSFVNSDPQMVKLMKLWLEEVMGIDKQEFLPRVAINEIHRSRIDKVLKFWVDLLELPLGQFRKTSFIKVSPRKVYDNYDNYYGTLVLRVRKSTNLRYKILGLIEAINYNVNNAGVAHLVRAPHS